MDWRYLQIAFLYIVSLLFRMPIRRNASGQKYQCLTLGDTAGSQSANLQFQQG